MENKNQSKTSVLIENLVVLFFSLFIVLVVVFALQGCTIGRTIHINSADNNATFEEETRIFKSKD